jgi:hypothetical protein
MVTALVAGQPAIDYLFEGRGMVGLSIRLILNN